MGGAIKWSNGQRVHSIIAALDAVKKKRSDREDALIGEVAMENGYGLITSDHALFKVMKERDVAVLFIALAGRKTRTPRRARRLAQGVTLQIRHAHQSAPTRHNERINSSGSSTRPLRITRSMWLRFRRRAWIRVHDDEIRMAPRGDPADLVLAALDVAARCTCSGERHTCCIIAISWNTEGPCKVPMLPASIPITTVMPAITPRNSHFIERVSPKIVDRHFNHTILNIGDRSRGSAVGFCRSRFHRVQNEVFNGLRR
jgi:hypothetical protein